MTNRSAWKRQARELAIKAAIEDWRLRNEWLRALADAGHGVPIPRLADWIVDYLLLFEEVLAGGTGEETAKRFKERWLDRPPAASSSTDAQQAPQ